jgi:hypothetical protein
MSRGEDGQPRFQSLSSAFFSLLILSVHFPCPLSLLSLQGSIVNISDLSKGEVRLVDFLQLVCTWVANGLYSLFFLKVTHSDPRLVAHGLGFLAR